jgi:hypothetical protein
MTQDEIIEMARQFCPYYSEELRGAYYDGFIKASKLAAHHERERIKAANAPEIERINAHIKKLEDAVLAEREACAKVCEEYADDSRTGATCAEVIRSRGNP